MSTENEKKIELSNWAFALILLSLLIIAFSFIAPWIFTTSTKVNLDFTNTGEIGDTLGGIMNPFIAIAGVIITFLAFYIQFEANKIQYESFTKEFKNNQRQSLLNAFESQFYEMIRLHKENANEFEIVIRKYREVNKSPESFEEIIKGRKVFKYLLLEFELLYNITKVNFPKEGFRRVMNEAYGIFYHGLRPWDLDKHLNFKLLVEIQKEHEKLDHQNLKGVVKRVIDKSWDGELEYKLFDGHSSQLGHYLRHLFHTVKFVVEQPEELFSYSDKRNFLRILRSQLSSQEQILLLYNWHSDFGKSWEDEKNKFFTDYRMIHNIVKYDLMPDVVIENIAELKRDFLKESNRISDPLFEFEDWNKK